MMDACKDLKNLAAIECTAAVSYTPHFHVYGATVEHGLYLMKMRYCSNVPSMFLVEHIVAISFRIGNKIISIILNVFSFFVC